MQKRNLDAQNETKGCGNAKMSSFKTWKIKIHHALNLPFNIVSLSLLSFVFLTIDFKSYTTTAVSNKSA